MFQAIIIIGGFVGRNDKIIDNVTSSGNVEGNDRVVDLLVIIINGTYSGNSYCQQNVLLPAAGDNARYNRNNYL